MEIFGAATGAAGLVGIFTSCLQLYDLIKLGSNHGRDYQVLHAKIQVEKVRFIYWGEAVGLWNNCGQYSSAEITRRSAILSRRDTEEAVIGVLNCIKLTFTDAEKIMSRYGLKLDANEDSSSSAIANRGPASQSRQSHGIRQALEERFRVFQQRIMQQQSQTSLKRKARWTLEDKKQIDLLVADLKGFNDSLLGLTPDRIPEVGEQMLRGIENMSNTENLRIIEEATAESYQSLSSAASSRRLALDRDDREVDDVRTVMTGKSSTFEEYFSALSVLGDDPGVIETIVEETTGNTKDPSGTIQPFRNLDTTPLTNQEGLSQVIEPPESSLEPGINSRHLPLTPPSPPREQTLHSPRENPWVGTPDAEEYGNTIAPIVKAQRQYDQDHGKTDNHYGSKWLNKEYYIVRTSDDVSYNVTPIHMEESYSQWLGCFEGPSGTPYAKGVFFVMFKVPRGYPFETPRVEFLTRVYHPNIDSRGQICVDFLIHQWNPTFRFPKVLLSISSLLSEPNIDDPIVPEIAATYVENFDLYCENARRYTLKYATTSQVDLERPDVWRPAAI